MNCKLNTLRGGYISSIPPNNLADHVRPMRSSPHNRMPVSFQSLGGDILLEVVEWLDRFDLLNLVTVVRLSPPRFSPTFVEEVSDILLVRSQSKTVYSQTIGALYRTVELNETDQCCTTLDMLYQHPDIARHVQKLVVRQGTCPDHQHGAGPSSPFRLFSRLASSRVCAAVKRVAGRLDALQSFVWGGEDYPSDDDIWLVLRKSCVSSFLSCACPERGVRYPVPPIFSFIDARS